MEAYYDQRAELTDALPKPILAFVHIPKNAGSLITYLLRSTFGMDHCRTVSAGALYGYDDLRRDFSIYPSMKALSGHPLRPYVDFKEFEQRLVWAVLLRDPYSRFPSQYEWWCKQNNSHVGFEQWCELKGERFSNFQCKWIGGSGDYKKAQEIIDSKNIIVGFQSNITGFLQKIVRELNLTGLPWDGSLMINAGVNRFSVYDKQLIERYNSEDIGLFNELKVRDDKTVTEDGSWMRPLNTNDKIRYYFNLIKHVVVYKPYKRIVLSR